MSFRRHLGNCFRCLFPSKILLMFIFVLDSELPNNQYKQYHTSIIHSIYFPKNGIYLTPCLRDSMYHVTIKQLVVYIVFLCF